MSTVVEAPVELIEAVAALRLPPRGDRQLQFLMDRNTNGGLSPEQKEELEALVELSETIASVRAPGPPVSWDGSRHEPLERDRSRGRSPGRPGVANIAQYTKPCRGATFHVEHIVPTSRGGTSELDNLAWCCPRPAI